MMSAFFLISSYNQCQNACRLFQVLAKFSFTTSELELDRYHQEVNDKLLDKLLTN